MIILILIWSMDLAYELVIVGVVGHFFLFHTFEVNRHSNYLLASPVSDIVLELWMFLSTRLPVRTKI